VLHGTCAASTGIFLDTFRGSLVFEIRMFRYLVLGLLRRGEPLHGYALMKEYRERAGVQISTGSFYRELARLVTEGLVRTASNPPGCDPRRAPYEITDLGATAFDAWFSEPLGTDAGPHEDGLSARSVFLAEAGPAAARPALERWHEELWQRGKALERERELALRAAEDGDGAFGVLALLLARRLKQVAADLEFLHELRTAYAQWTTAPCNRASLPVRPARRRELGIKSQPR
jgi:DNA-binding PadR family transcriptional regulator